VILSDPKIKQTLDNTEYVTANLKQTTDDLNVLMHNDVPALLAKLESVGSNTEQLTGKLKDLDYATTLAKVNETVAQVNAMTKDLNEKLNSREGSLGLMLNDKTLYTNLNKTIESSNALMTDLKAHPKRYVHFSVFGKKDK
jgi:phospholipid/cholesterol/gamma-HCH transport system substrate-binding protein